MLGFRIGDLTWTGIREDRFQSMIFQHRLILLEGITPNSRKTGLCIGASPTIVLQMGDGQHSSLPGTEFHSLAMPETLTQIPFITKIENYS
ncbi:hypothetical protein CEXT_85651 [Caerostris extrusa]|uniref:Uncharacterized protein n=1 Tax=Caerostris extrusa TaxID=172846 RepID=A0AAV4SD96_CAEEX|nr:hypothetical protein CEXT_85651 [Caerostris extrusa]